MTLDTININGDVIEFNGDEIARINPKFIGTVRDKFENAINSNTQIDKSSGILDDVMSESKEKMIAGMITIEELESIIQDIRNNL